MYDAGQVYGDIFARVYKDEQRSSGPVPPVFGDAFASSDAVRAFYAWWERFNTNREFGEVDCYNPGEVGALCAQR